MLFNTIKKNRVLEGQEGELKKKRLAGRLYRCDRVLKLTPGGEKLVRAVLLGEVSISERM